LAGRLHEDKSSRNARIKKSEEFRMSIEKKSLISALKTTKKANIASTPVEGEKAVSAKALHSKAVSSKAVSAKAVSAKAVSAKAVSAKAVSAKAVSAKSVSAKAVR
jgi:hypothetical protein